MIRNKHLTQIEITYGELRQPIIGTASTVIKAIGTEVGRELEIKSRISDLCSSLDFCKVQFCCVIYV
jgi:hypothetical protein